MRWLRARAGCPSDGPLGQRTDCPPTPLGASDPEYLSLISNPTTLTNPNSNFNLTAEEQRIMAEATPEMWAEAAAEIAKDGKFWQELATTMALGFLNGLTRGLADD